MLALIAAPAKHHLVCGTDSSVEVIAAIRRCAHRGDIAAPDMAAVLAQFRQDFVGLYHRIEITPCSWHGR
jgi:hypothetical protein